ncbi:PCDG7 protein, partial [Chaetorhynchus papuensis]|nr:PCDG7 protein [Chaetorhynchus papuensis]
VAISVTDVNDNAPELTVTSQLSAISEDSPPGTVVALLHVQDRDLGVNGEVRCSLDRDIPFRLQSSHGSYYSVVTARELDREQVSEYNVTVRAADGGSPPLQSSAVLSLRVLDVNDNAPVFSQAEYTVRVPEDVPVGSVLVTVTATDADEGLNGHVKYSLKKVSDVASDIFHVDPETGEITLMQSLDFEEGDSYELEVQARDGGGLSDTTKVVITVTDVNDNVPQISVRSALSEISEDAPSGTVIALLHVHDRDSGANGEVRCSIDGSVPFQLQSSHGSYYSVVTTRELDREQVSEYNVTVRAADGGSPPLQSSAVLSLRLWINVTDANDNPPVFAQDRYRVSLREDAPPGSTVLNVSASDADAGTNARITYGFGKTAAKVLQKFLMDAESGTITLKEALDFENTRGYTLLVEARDGGGLVAHCEVELEVLDVNDNVPEI